MFSQQFHHFNQHFQFKLFAASIALCAMLAVWDAAVYSGDPELVHAAAETGIDFFARLTE